MSVASPAAERIDSAAALGPESRQALRDLVLALADSKRVLGLRYSDRMLGAPTLEAAIAASSMAQDEWGHARLTYALLGDLGDEPKTLEHERPAAEYRSIPALDAPFASWADTIAAALLVDGALTVQYAALAESRYAPAHNRVQKMLDEERFHFQYAAGWARKMAAVPEIRPELAASLARVLPEALRWLGSDDAPACRRLADEGLVAGGPSELRRRFIARVAPVLIETGLADELGIVQRDGAWTYAGEVGWSGWNESTRRSGGSLDEVTAARARGDKNRALLMD
ncbi:MAG TPA: Phenylacetic acid catabolic protein [Longimicrobium sp.]|nr:Phenylacetic acid catabolic protein [Longimicrobium sp.]